MNKNKPLALVFALAMSCLIAGDAHAQTQNAWGYSTGYGNVYGTFGLAHTMQSMYNVARAKARTRAEGQASPPSSGNQGSGQPGGRKAPSVVVRNYGKYNPTPAGDYPNVFANSLGDTPEERTLIKQIYSATKSAFDQEAAARGWSDNIAAGLTFFTVTAMTVYHDSAEPGDEAVKNYFKIMNAALDDMPEFAKVTNKDKQNFNNMLVGFSGILIATYTEGKQTENAETLAAAKKLSGMLIEMILKTGPENIVLENEQIVLK